MKREAGWRVEVAYAMPLCQEVIELTVQPGASIEQVIRESGLLERFPESTPSAVRLERHAVVFQEIPARPRRVDHEFPDITIPHPRIR